MTPEQILGLLGALLVFAFVANKLFRVTRVPDVLVLMLIGLLAGPVLGLIHAEQFKYLAHVLGTLAIVLILFEGGLELDLRGTLRYFPGALFFATAGYVFSTVAAAAVLWKWFGLSVPSSVLVGAVLGCTSSTVVLPVLQGMKAREPVRLTLMLESAWADMLAVLTVGIMLSTTSLNAAAIPGFVKQLLFHVLVSVLIAVLAGVLWSRLLPILSGQRFWHILTFAFLLLLYAGTEALKANGLVAVLGFGIMLANFPTADPRTKDLPSEMEDLMEYHQERMLNFHSELSFLVRTFFFILLGAVAELRGFRAHLWVTLLLIVALLCARWLALQCSRWAWRDFSDKEQSLVLWMLPRGLITAVLAIQVLNSRGDSLSFLPQLAFAVILSTNLMLTFASFGTATRDSTESAMKGDETQRRLKVRGRLRAHWKLDLAILVVLIIAAVLFWSSRNPEEVQKWRQKIAEIVARRGK